MLEETGIKQFYAVSVLLPTAQYLCGENNRHGKVKNANLPANNTKSAWL